jgi:hypothetical protein
MAGDVFHHTMTVKEKPIVPSFNPEDLQETPELPKATPAQQVDRDSYILNNPRSGVAQLPNGEQGPSQGPNIPIKNYGGRYMPNGSQPSGYRPGPTASKNLQGLVGFTAS